MPPINLSVEELLSTTRSVRKRLDFKRPVDLDLIKECLTLALQAPTASNSQGWHFVVVTDGDKKSRIADYYRMAWASYAEMAGSAPRLYQDDPAMRDVQLRVIDSARYLAENLQKVPVFLIPCVRGRVDTAPQPGAVTRQAGLYGSIIPAVWSFMLAARSRGLGTCYTTFHLQHEKEVAEILGIPFEKFTQVALVPVAYALGEAFRPAPRKPLEDVLHLESW